MDKGSRKARWDVGVDFERDLASRGEEEGLGLLYRLVARFSVWVDPQVAAAVPVVFDRSARAVLGHHRPGDVEGGIRYWGNQPAKAAFFAALGLSPKHFENAVVAHVYPGTVGDPNQFTRLANLVVVPSPLWAFTDWQRVGAMLQRRAFELYEYKGPGARVPGVPALYPDSWSLPVIPEDVRRVIARLARAHDRRPMYSTPGGGKHGQGAQGPWRAFEDVRSRGDIEWSMAEWRRLEEGPAPSLKRSDARDLEQEFWAACEREGRTLRAIVGWVAGNAYFAPVAVEREIANPFPGCRRARLSAGERAGQVVGGVTLATNTAAAYAFFAAIRRPLRETTGGNVDHAWPEAPQLPAHFCNLKGLTLVARPLGSLVDSEPIRAILKRRLFERTGYAGPTGERPPVPAFYPKEWPETVRLTEAQERKAVEMLKRYRRERPGYYRRSAGASLERLL